MQPRAEKAESETEMDEEESSDEYEPFEDDLKKEAADEVKDDVKEADDFQEPLADDPLQR